MRGIERSWPERYKIWGANKVCRWRVQKKQTNFHYYRQSKFITNTLAFTFSSELSIWGGSDIVRRHARPAARLARRLEGEDLFAG